MNIRTVYLLIIFSFTFCLARNADSSDTTIQLKTYLEETSVPLNREVVYQVELTWPGDLELYDVIKTTEPALTNLELRRSGSSNRIYTDSHGHVNSVKRITYYFTPQGLGMAYVDGITVQYLDNRNNEIQTLLAQRLEVKIVEAVDLPGEAPGLKFMLILAGSILFIALVIYFSYRYFAAKKLQKTVETAEIKSLEETCLADIKSKTDNKNSSLDEKFEVLLKSLNSYLMDKYTIEGGISYSKFAVAVADEQLDESLLERLKQFYERAELTRFAGEQMSESDYHLFHDTVELFLKAMLRSNRT